MKDIILASLLFGAAAQGQQQCQQSGQATTTGNGANLDNRVAGCSYFRLTYWAVQNSAISISIQGAQDVGGIPGSYSDFATVIAGANPSTTTGSGTIVVNGYYPWVSINIGTLTGGTVKWTLAGQSGPNSASASSNNLTVGALVVNQTTQSITTAGNILVQFPTKIRDDDNFWATGTNTRLTIPLSGWYNFSVTVRWAANNTGQRRMTLVRNGASPGTYTDLCSSAVTVGTSDPNDPAISCTANYYMTVADYVQVSTYQDSGGTINTAYASLSAVLF